MTASRVCWRRIETRLVGFSGFYGRDEGVVDFQDDAFGAVVAVELGLVLALHDGEGVHDVGHGGAGRGERLGQGGGLLTPLGLRAEVEVEEGGIHETTRETSKIRNSSKSFA